MKKMKVIVFCSLFDTVAIAYSSKVMGSIKTKVDDTKELSFKFVLQNKE